VRIGIVNGKKNQSAAAFPPHRCLCSGFWILRTGVPRKNGTEMLRAARKPVPGFDYELSILIFALTSLSFPDKVKSIFYNFTEAHHGETLSESDTSFGLQ
jgi:hypothetical protein